MRAMTLVRCLRLCIHMYICCGWFAHAHATHQIDLYMNDARTKCISFRFVSISFSISLPIPTISHFIRVQIQICQTTWYYFGLLKSANYIVVYLSHRWQTFSISSTESLFLSLSLFNCILCVQNCLLFQLPCINSKVSVRKRTFPISTFDLVFPFIRNKNSLLVSERRKNSCRWFHMEIQLEHNVSTWFKWFIEPITVRAFIHVRCGMHSALYMMATADDGGMNKTLKINETIRLGNGMRETHTLEDTYSSMWTEWNSKNGFKCHLEVNDINLEDSTEKKPLRKFNRIYHIQLFDKESEPSEHLSEMFSRN